MIRFLLVLSLLAGLAHAHNVPIDPSLCAFEPFELTAPAIGFAATAAPATDGDRFRIRWEAESGLAQFCLASDTPGLQCLDAPTRAFTGGAVTGTLDVSGFQGHATKAGDIAVPGARIAITLGAETATVTIALTTGLAVADSTLAEGAPIAADGTFTLVGSAPSSTLPAPLGGTPLLVRMTCRAAPPPDIDQFLDPAITKSMGGKITPSVTKLSTTFSPGETTPDFTSPVLVRLSSADTTIATVALPGGLTAKGRRKFIGESADGLASVTVTVKGRGRSYKLSLRLPTATMPSTSSKRADAQLTYQVGGLLSRGTHTLRVMRGRS